MLFSCLVKTDTIKTIAMLMVFFMPEILEQQAFVFDFYDSLNSVIRCRNPSYIRRVYYFLIT